MKKVIDTIVFLGITYPYGVLSGIIFQILCALRVIRVLYWERFPHRQDNLILVSNHPSLLEPFLLPALFFKDYLFHPLKYAPWSTPDKSNFYDRWYWFWARPRTIPVDRGEERKEARSVIQMKNVLNSGGIIILFAEGGRTCFGEKFQFSPGGKKIRVLKNGVGWLALKTGATVLPVWVEGTDKVLPNSPDRRKLFCFPRFGGRITIKIGNPLRFQKGSQYLDKEQITSIIKNALLELADEE
jgi:1-acyl-sn-glycerol-3-phosphate acyltransferase